MLQVLDDNKLGKNNKTNTQKLYLKSLYFRLTKLNRYANTIRCTYISYSGVPDIMLTLTY